MRAPWLVLFAVFMSPSIEAQDYKTLLDIPEGATLVNLSASERAEVDEDLLVANLRYQTEHKQPRALQDEINAVMSQALAAAKQVASVRTATGVYQVYEVDLNLGKKHLPPDRVWRGRQAIVLKGKQADELLDLVATLQQLGLSVSGLDYMVSPELLEAQRESLLEAALMKLQSKAQRTAKTLGKSKTDFLQIDIDMGGGHPPPAPRIAMAEAAVAQMTTPVAAPGQTEITLTVTATALVKD